MYHWFRARVTNRQWERSWWYRHVPGGGGKGVLGWCEALYWNYIKFRAWCPLLTLTSGVWWRMVRKDYQKGFTTCPCGKTWFRYRLLPALVGDKRFGGGC